MLAYNASCIAGWSYVLLLWSQHVFSAPIPCCHHALFERLSSVYLSSPLLAPALTYVQLAAVLEIVHAATGLVGSPAFVTAMQVMSRVVAIVAIVFSPNAQTHFGAGLMILGWALVEVPRYSFYAVGILKGGDSSKTTPYALFWLRYSLFAVLYPLGISGECFTFWNAIHDKSFLSAVPFGYAIYAAILASYVPGGPFMYMNMVGNRAGAFKKRFAKPPPPETGLVFPLCAAKGNKPAERSTSEAGANILQAAIRAVDTSYSVTSKNWRFGYVRHFKKMVELQCKSEAAALKIAEAGLDYMHSNFQFIAEPNGKSISFKQAMEAKTEGYETGFFQGTGKAANDKLTVPYKGKDLSGDELKAQVAKWVKYGTIEPSAGDAINKCIDNPKWFDLKDKYFVLLGAGSAMGPFNVLMALGANIVAVDVDVTVGPFAKGMWKRLIDTAKKSAGSITFPLKKAQGKCATDDEIYENAGCNLFSAPARVRDWLLDLYPGKDFVVGTYVYLDGARHVQVSLAGDAICKALTEKRKASLAYLCTPTDIHLVPKEAYDASLKEYNRMTFGRLFESFWQIVSNGKFLKKNAKTPFKSDTSGKEFNWVDGLSVAQGPNYALAKRLQHWRAIVARSKGCVVSSNVAPATSTISVVSNVTFAWAYGGMPYFKPYEISHPDLSKAVMLALLVSDIRDPKSVANPKTELDNPNQLFQYGSFNGGAWRCAYTVDSIGEVSVFVHFAKCSAPYAVAVGGVLVAAAAKWFGLF